MRARDLTLREHRVLADAEHDDRAALNARRDLLRAVVSRRLDPALGLRGASAVLLRLDAFVDEHADALGTEGLDALAAVFDTPTREPKEAAA